MYMKKVLIISDYFAPDNEIAAIRLTKIAKYLSLYGYNVDVLRRGNSHRKEDNLLKIDLQYIQNIYKNMNSGVFNYLYIYLTKKINTYKSDANNKLFKLTGIIKKSSILLSIKNTIMFIINELINTNYYKNAIKNKNIKYSNYSCIISSYGPISSHYIALHIKKNNKSIRWIADFRDSVYDYSLPFVFKSYRKRFEKTVLKYANIITSVSTGCFSIKASKVNIIPNGFDLDDIKNIYIISNANKFIFTYAGTMYSGKSNFSAFFKIINELLKENTINKEQIDIRYLGKSFTIFKEQCEKYLPDDLIHNYGFVPREESLRIQAESNALLLASWNVINNKSIITGKFYEYLMFKKPILCFISGNIPDSALKKLILETETGYCYEEAHSIEDYDKIKNYIKNLIISWKLNISFQFNCNNEFIAQYSYKNIVNNILAFLGTCSQ